MVVDVGTGLWRDWGLDRVGKEEKEGTRRTCEEIENLLKDEG